ncbi:PREDICTED: probable serine/threonine-protein kinase kinX isoform X2 [Vollenhovia emeryi]|uniref:probable serine/threonine-protein kinase kinX isoform X2 n=1 Tax=Vollenhovia emeryi TaxID=411798 RepID=UPI0005F44920|nr:PREDICTED: probable serine/threonine-protein kinase kinX isoform X2 [Vollenhovia emeryi]
MQELCCLPYVGSRLGMRRDPCAACGLPVFLAEKLLIAGAPYHRTCFRCARCTNQLTPGNYYETEEGQYCCETCPDEEETDSVRHRYAESAAMPGEKNEAGPLSDEEKTERKGMLENAAVPDLISHTSQMRQSFMTSHLLSEKLESTAKDTSASTKDVDSGRRDETKSRVDSAFPDDDENEEEEEENDDDDDDDDDEEEEEESRSSVTGSPDMEKSNVERYDVHSALNSLDIRSDEDQRSTAISFHDIDKKRGEEDTKESPGRADERANPETRLSLVQKRLQMFEARDKGDHVDKTDHSKKRSAVTQNVTMVQGDSCDTSPDVLSVNEEERPEKRLEEDSIIKIIDKHKDSFDTVGIQRKKDSTITHDERSEENFSKDVVQANNGERLDKDTHFEESSKVRSIEKRKESLAKIEDRRIEANEMNKGHYESAMGSSVLTAKGINLSEEYPEDLNPFKSDEEDDATGGKPRTVINSSRNNKVSTNPFDSEDEDVEEPEPPKPAARSKPENREMSATKRILAAPQINLNPFWSEDEDEEQHGSDEERRDGTPPGNMPVPKPRTIKTTLEVSVTPRRADLDRGGMYASNSSLTSSESTTTPGGTYKKKKPAPQPPVAKELFPSEQGEPSILKSCSSTLPYHDSSSRTTPRARKTKPAPPPPMPTSTPRNISIGSALTFDESPIIKLRDGDRNLNMWEDQKTNKDEANRNRQSLSSISCADSSSYTSYADKSVQGKWKRKKGPAPPRPIPHRRKIKVVSMKDVKLELDEIELQQQGLERQGVRLEQLIRDKCETGPRADDSSLGTDVEELVLELFALVNEKNELFRRQAELMLLRRQQRLEEEHAEVEYQIRCLMCQPEATKTDSDKQREEALIQRLVEIVERRNEIVECLEMDRRREVEEDRSINKHMGLFAARNKNELWSGKDNDSSNAGKTKKGKMKEKKEKKFKKAMKKDADKDVDETEVKLKRHGKRKWF